MRYHWEKKKNR